AVGAVVFIIGLAGWITQLLPGRGHSHEPLSEERPQALSPAPGTVEQMQTGMPGYRMRLPEKVHPITAGIKGGLLGALVMPIPALIWGLLSEQHSLWLPVNLLAGMVVPDMVDPGLTREEQARVLSQFHLWWFVVALFIHIIIAAGFGTVYGVLLPTLPHVSKPFAWGGVLMPVLWTGVSYS